MLHEYAVDPDLVVSWVDRGTGRYFIDKFGLGSPRVLSRYPRSQWKKLVWRAWYKADGDCQDNKKRMEVLIKKLWDEMVDRRSPEWDSRRAWWENAVVEHKRLPFHAILARVNPTRDSAILVADELDESTRRWNPPRSIRVPRRADDIGQAVGGLLRTATDIVFVDPYFDPYSPGHVNVLAACLRICLQQRATASPRVRILGSQKKLNHEQFERQCRQALPRRLPSGQDVTICRLTERPRGEKLHNRYVLTELGGVSFGASLTEAGNGATDDLSLLDRQVYRDRWQQYASDVPAFDCPERAITVTGTGRRSRSRRHK